MLTALDYDELASIIVDTIAEAFAPLREQIAALEGRVAELQSQPGLKYQGVWTSDLTYAPGSVVTHAGSMWHANIQTKGVKPGEDQAGWTLCVKHGRDLR